MIKSLLIKVFIVFLVLSTTSCDGERSRSSGKRITKKQTTSKASKKRTSEEEESKEIEKSKITPEQLAKAKEIIAATDQEVIDAINAKKKFKLYCTICHGIKGDMQINGAKDLSKSKISLEESVAQVYYGQGLMTPFKGILKDDEIVAVAKYVELLRR